MRTFHEGFGNVGIFSTFCRCAMTEEIEVRDNQAL